MLLLVVAKDAVGGDYAFRKNCATHDESGVLDEPFEVLIQVYYDVPLRVRFRSCRSTLAMRDGILAA